MHRQLFASSSRWLLTRFASGINHHWPPPPPPPFTIPVPGAPFRPGCLQQQQQQQQQRLQHSMATSTAGAAAGTGEKMKYILVTGGVISGVGKGVIASSFGTLLKSCGINVTSIKIDPYINIDAGTFSPFEHGEVYVLDDGSEVDLDLGNYERFLDVQLHGRNNITTGKIYSQVIRQERAGDFLGKTVQVVPHITNAIQDWVHEVAHQPVSGNHAVVPQVCIIELGGTIGDIEGMPFVEAFRQFQFRVGRDNFCCAHVSLVPTPRCTGEPKTKPTQSSVRELRGLGLQPDLIVCRSENPIDGDVKEKISNFCHVPTEQVICIHDLSSIYHVPLAMEQHNIVQFLRQRLSLSVPAAHPTGDLQRWRQIARRIDTVTDEVRIALVGKYTKLEDSYASVLKSLQHAALDAGYKLRVDFIEACRLEEPTPVGGAAEAAQHHEAWQTMCAAHGVIVPGGFGARGMEGKILACQWCRENSMPLLGICLGFQAAAIEFARNVLQLEGANTREIAADTGHPVVVEMLEYTPQDMGGTMRLGSKRTTFTEAAADSKIWQLYGRPEAIHERHRHRYEINGEYVAQLEAAGMRFVGVDDRKERMEVMELLEHPYYVGVQFHPEYTSRPLRPSPPFVGLILAAKGQLAAYLANGGKHRREAEVNGEVEMGEKLATT